MRRRVYKSVFSLGGIYLSACSLFLLTLPAFAQLPADSLSARFLRYQQANFQEKIYLHTDKDVYVSGEIMWFKVYQVGSASNTPSGLSKIAYAELIDKNQVPVLQATIAVEQGSGSGSFQLPASLPSGNYRLRAYTAWMRNFDPAFFFEKTIPVANTLIKPERIVADNLPLDIQFFPEGGDLVEGLTSRIAFRGIDGYGRGAAFSGAIVNSRNDTLLRFTPQRYGIGSFKLKPLSGESYRAVIRQTGKPAITVNLPKVQRNGVVLSLEENDTDLTFTFNASPGYEGYISFIAHTRGDLKLNERISLSSGTGSISVNKSRLGDGISHFTVFDAEGRPLGERLYFKRPAGNISMNLTPNHREIGRRQKLSIDIQAAGLPPDMPFDGSMAVISAEDGLSDAMNISNYLWLKSDLKGYVEDPGYYFSSNDPQASEGLDNLMLTHGWRRFTWRDVAAASKQKPFLPEIQGQIIRGRVTDTRTNQPAANVLTYLSVPGKKFQLYPASSKGDGKVTYYTSTIYGPAEIVTQTNTMIDSTYRVDIDAPFAPVTNTATPVFDLPDNLRNQVLAQSLSAQLQNVYLGDKIRTFFSSAPDSSAFYVRSDKRYLLDDFVRFNTMEEVLREYVSEVPVARRRDEFTLWTAVKPHYNYPFRNVEPLQVFDGVPVFDTGTKMVRYDPKKIREIEVLTQKYFRGPAVFNSIIEFKSYKHTLPDFQLDRRASVIDYDGAQLQREFYSPVYETEEQKSGRVPDFRSLLFWKPDVTLDPSGRQTVSFYTSDQKGRYTVVLQGIAADGKTAVAATSIDVK